MIAEKIEATLLNPSATTDDYFDCVEHAQRLGCPTVIVPPFVISNHQMDSQRWRYAKDPIRVGTVIGYPDGTMSTKDKCQMIENYNSLVDDLDVVMNLTYLKSAKMRWRFHLEDELNWIGDAAQQFTKIIIEAPLLEEDEIKEATLWVAKKSEIYPNIQIVKTATGRQGATTLDHVKWIREVLGKDSEVGIKVSGGVRTLEQIKFFDQYNVYSYGVGYPNFITLIEEEQHGS